VGLLQQQQRLLLGQWIAALVESDGQQSWQRWLQDDAVGGGPEFPAKCSGSSSNTQGWIQGVATAAAAAQSAGAPRTRSLAHSLVDQLQFLLERLECLALWQTKYLGAAGIRIIGWPEDTGQQPRHLHRSPVQPEHQSG